MREADLTAEGVNSVVSSSSVFVAGLAVGGVESNVSSSNGVVAGVPVEGVDSIVSSFNGCAARRLQHLLFKGVNGSVSSSKGFVAVRLDTVVEAEGFTTGRPATGASDVDADAGCLSIFSSKGFVAWMSPVRLLVADVAAEGVDCFISSPGGFVDWLVPVRFDTVLEAFGLPCGIFNLDASVADVGADSLSLCRCRVMPGAPIM